MEHSINSDVLLIFFYPIYSHFLNGITNIYQVTFSSHINSKDRSIGKNRALFIYAWLTATL
ncbi:hypothetical protein BCR42DRAFT_428839 [Absidia repens]|uniref:Uncharacterized protein n=1 Tax=Absidia repens TaxID=90262 RepID=A0A1X2HXW2_9FUNG|nr:hypothetical protein BCR42DRAFT_428839 [Absidia repens]